ncbi:MAG: multidrug ABC transporter permease [Deltaproteobacteria bacterium]|nr:multidrug ABC transporter permease [Deltaproteobacteria bacterium]
MRLVSLQAIYVMWARMIRRTWRSRSQLVGSILFPLLFLFFLGTGFKTARFSGLPMEGGYLGFLGPGIVAMTLLFSSTFSGLSVLWDRQFGFLREIMVTPVSRLSIFLGRIASGMTLGLGQATVIYLGAVLLGLGLPPLGHLALAIVAASLTSVVFLSLGLVFSSLLKDPHGFGLIMNFVVFPLFFLSGALFPVGNLPLVLRWLAYLDPLTYGVDALRATLTAEVWTSPFPLGLPFDLAMLTGFAILFITVGVALFDRVEVG